MLRISYELNSSLIYRRVNRIFGNIDNSIKELSNSEIVSHELEVTLLPRVENIFEQDDIFLRYFDA